MACHPDLERMQKETRNLRIEDAWGRAFQHCRLSDNAQTRMEADVMMFQSDTRASLVPRSAPSRREKKKKKEALTPTPRLVKPKKTCTPLVSVLGCVKQVLGKKIKFRCTSFPNATRAFSTSFLHMTMDQDRVLRGNFIIEYDHTETPMELRVTGPDLHIHHDMNRNSAREYFTNYMFDVYVRIVATLRGLMFLNELEVTMNNCEDDTMFVQNVNTPTHILGETPPNQIRFEYPRQEHTTFVVQDSIDAICRQLGISKNVPKLKHDNSNESSSESSSEGEEDEGVLF